ncbi:MAG: DUF4426 domain-containing protein [Arenimonas sp.]
MSRNVAWRIALAFALSVTGIERAPAQSVTVDGITVHYAALPASELDESLARRLGIVRSDKRVLLNIAVRTGPVGQEQVVQAQVDVRVRDAAGDLPSPRMREVHDAGGDYHLGEVRIAGQAHLAFVVEVRVAGRTTPIRATFDRDFFPGPGP